MALAILGPLNGVINKTTTEMINNQISTKLADVVSTFVKASFEAVDSVLQSLQELTKKETGNTP